jgi:hypothetical protein
MPQYRIVGTTRLDLDFYVEADSLEQAFDKARTATLPTLCSNCKGRYHGEWTPADPTESPRIIFAQLRDEIKPRESRPRQIQRPSFRLGRKIFRLRSE